MGDRAVYCARLESVCAERHRGFESPPIRQANCWQLIWSGFTLRFPQMKRSVCASPEALLIKHDDRSTSRA
jgi:hypothetical protein